MISTLYIYADGSDLDAIANEVRGRIEAFVKPYQGRVRVVDQRADENEDSADLPDWDLGVNFEIEALSAVEKKDLVLFFQSLSAEFGRDFVIGGALPHGLADDFVTISVHASVDDALDFLLTDEKEANQAPDPTAQSGRGSA